MKKFSNNFPAIFVAFAIVFAGILFISRFLPAGTAFAAAPLPDIEIPTFNIPEINIPKYGSTPTSEEEIEVDEILKEFVEGNVSILIAVDGIRVYDENDVELFYMNLEEEELFFKKLYQEYGIVLTRSEADENDFVLTYATPEEMEFLDEYYETNGAELGASAGGYIYDENGKNITPRTPEEKVAYQEVLQQEEDAQRSYEAALQQEHASQRAAEVADRMISISFTVMPIIIFVVIFLFAFWRKGKKQQQSASFDYEKKRPAQTQGRPYQQATYERSTPKPSYQYGSIPYAKPVPKKDVSMDYDHCDDDRDYDKPVEKSVARLEQDERFSYALNYDKDKRRKKIDQIQSLYDSGMIDRDEYDDYMKQWK